METYVVGWESEIGNSIMANTLHDMIRDTTKATFPHETEIRQ